MTAQIDRETEIANKRQRYVDMSEITEYVGNVTQLSLETLQGVLLTLRPNYEEFKAYMGPETFKKYEGDSPGAERILLPPEVVERISVIDDKVDEIVKKKK